MNQVDFKLYIIMAITILTLNIQGLRNQHNRQTLIQWLNCFSPDIVALQETHSTSEKEFSDWFSLPNVPSHNFKYKTVSSSGKQRSCRVLLIKAKLIKKLF